MSVGAHKSFPSHMPTALLTTALIVLWLSLYGGDLYSNHLLKDMAIFFYCQDLRDNPGSLSEDMRLRQGELNRVPSMNCLAIYISTRGYAKTILREITVSISYHLSSPE